MNKAYRHVYKDGIGWVAIAENGSCVSSSKGSGTVSAKTKVEVLKNFFDLRNSVVLNNGFLLKGLFAATLFCGVFVTQGFAEVTQKEILDIQNNGTAVYTDNDGNRMEKIINEEGEVIFADGSILNKADSDGIIHIDGKDYVVPTGTLNKPDTDEFGDKAKLFRVKKDETTGEWRGLTFKELKAEDSKLTMGAITTKNGKFQTVIYDKDKKKWFVHNQASEAQLYQAKKKNGEVAYYAWTSIQKDINGVPLKTVDGYYMPLANATAEANEIKNLGYDIVQVASKNKAERLSLVGIDGKTVKPIKYTKNDQQVKDGKKNIGDNKDGTIRLGNVAKAELDDEAVNLGQLNERLQNVKAGKVPYVSIKSSIKGDGSNYDSDGAKGENSIAIGPNAQATNNSAISVGYNAGNSSQGLDSFVFIGNNAGYKATNTSKPSGGSTSGVIAIGRHAGSESNGDRNLFIGSHAGEKHTGSSNIFIGDVSKPFNYDEFAPEKNNRTDGDNSQYNTYGHRNILIGAQIIKHSDKEYYPKNDKNINDTISIGTLATASKEKSIAIGSSSVNNFSGALATGKSSIAIGSSYYTTYHGSISSGEASIALGASSKATEYKSIAIGTKSEANAKESVAIGNESIATRGAIQDKKDVYLIEDEAVAKTASRTKGAVSVGFEGVEKTRRDRITGKTHTSIEGDIRRQITNVAAGSKDSDAVNIAQLKAATGSNPQLFKFLGVTDKNYADKVDGYEDGGKYYDGNGKELPKEKISIDSDGRITKLILSDTQDTPDGNGDLTVKYDRLSPLNSIKTVKIDPNTNKPEVDQKGDFVFEYTVGDSPKNYFETINDITNSVNKGFYTEANLANNEEKNTIIKHQLGSKIKVGGNFKPLDGKTLTKDNINNYLSGENLATSINKDGSINLLMTKTPKFDDINISKDGKGGEYTNLTQWIKKIENSSSTSTGDKIKYFSVNSKEVGNRNNDGAKGDNAIAIGQNAQAKAQNVVAIGESAGKTQFDNGSGSVFIGRNAGLNSNIIDHQGAQNWGSVYIGQDAGNGSKGDGNLYLGSNTGFQHDGSQNIFLGDGARNLKDGQIYDDKNLHTQGNRNIAIGNQYVHNPAKINTHDDAIDDTIIIGTGTRASADRAIAIGSAYDYGYDNVQKRTYYTATAANGVSSIALGSGILVNSKNGVAVGFGSSIVDDKVTDAVALGSYSQATTKAFDAGTKNVYLGNNAEVAKTVASTKGAISIGSAIKGLDENGKTVEPFTRQITNLAAGTKDTDAVNVAQLKAGIKNVVKYDSDANDKITLGGLDNAKPKVAGGVTITNLKDGTVSENSKDAINGSQLHATNESIKQNTDKITKNEGDITTINQKLDGFNKDSLFKVSKNGVDPQNIGLNGEVKFNSDENIGLTVEEDTKGANVKYSLNKDLKNITSITNNGKKYTFGDTNLVETSVITNKDLTEKGYVTADTQKTTSVSTDTNSGIKVADKTTGKNTDYKLSLDKDKVKEIAGTTNLTADLDKKADKNAGNLEAADVASWQKKLGDGTNSAGNTGLITGDTLNKSLIDYSQNSDKTAEVSAGKGLKLDSDKTTNVAKYKLSLDEEVIKKLAGTEDLDDLKNEVKNKADIDATNVEGEYLTKWQEKLGVSELSTTINDFKTSGLFKVSSNSKNPEAIVPNAIVDFTAGNVGTDTNLIVSHTKTNDGVKVNYTLNNELKNINSIGGNGKTVSFKTDGVDFGGAKIKNVAEGDVDTDGVNLKQVKTLIANVGTTNLVEVQTNSPMAFILDKEGEPRVQLVREKDPKDNKTKFFRLDDKNLEDPITDGNGNFTNGGEVGDQIKISTIHPGYGVADKTKITNVKAGNVTPDSLEAINGSQLHASNKAIADILGGGSTLNNNGVVTKPTYNITNKDGANITHNTIGGALTELNEFNKNFTEEGLFSVSKDSATPLNIKPNENISFAAGGSNLDLTVEKGAGNKGAKITYSLKDDLEGIKSIASKTNEPLKVTSNGEDFYFNNTDGTTDEKKRNVATMGDLDDISGDTGALKKAVAGDNKLNSNGIISQNADETKTPFTTIKTADDPEGKGDTKPKTLFETVDNTIKAVNKGFKTGANFDADNISTKDKEVQLQLGSTIKVTGASKLTANELSGENLATSINKDGSINLLMSKAPRFDSVNIGGEEGKPDSGIKIAQDGKDGNVLKLSKKGADGKDGKVILRGLADGKDDSDAVTKSQLDEVRNLAKGGSVGNIEFITDDNERTKLANNELNIKGDGNIKTSKVKDGEIKLSLGDEISFGGEITNPDGTKTKTPKITLGKDGLTTTGADGKAGPSITANGIDGGNKVLTNLASGLNGKTLEDIKKDIEKANGDPAKMPTEASNGATIGDLVDVDSKITNINTNITNTTNIIGGNDNKLINKDGTLTDEGKKALTTNAASGQDVIKNTNIIQAINNINKQGTRFFHVNDGKEPMGKKVREDKEDSSAGSIGSVAIGIQAEVGQNAKDAIAIGTGSQANGKNTIAIGVGNIVNGENSGAIGDPSMVEADGSYSVGNSNTVSLGANGSFILGNNVTIEKDAKQALALGEKTKVSVASGVALGSDSVANRITNLQGYIPDGATADQEKAIKATSKGSLGVVSVGETSADGKTVKASRQITGVAAGTQDSDAVNVAQLKAVQKVSQSAQWIAADNRKFDKNGKVVDNNTPAEAKGVNSVAIGAGSNTKVVSNGNIAERPNTVSVGGMNEDGTVTQRSISNVAPGVLNSDAATMGQLRAGLNDVYGKLGEYKKDASAGTASALAVGNLPQATIPGKGMVSLGSGFYDGESAMAIGLSKMSDSGKWVFKGSASYDSQEKAGAALSVGFHF
jgi:outer membrane protein